MKQPFAIRLAAVLAVAALVAGSAAAQTTYPEVEPNDNKTQALGNGASLMTAGDMLTGTTTGSSTTTPGLASADYWLVQTTPLALGVYRHELAITTTGTAGHTGRIRGLSQSLGVINTTSDNIFQTSATGTTPPRMNAWYGFGKGEQIYYAVTGTSSTTGPYTSTLTTTAVPVPFIGNFQAGSITITTAGQGHTTDTDLWIYDGNLDAIPGWGNDDKVGLQSRLTRCYTPGTYYLAVSRFGFANDLPSPSDDNYRNGTVLDFPNAAAGSSSVLVNNCAFAITDWTGTYPFPATTAQPYEVLWFCFNVVPSTWGLSVTQPGGLPGSEVSVRNVGGTPGNLYLNIMTQYMGNFPAGWAFGVDIPFSDLVAEILWGAPFFGPLDGCGESSWTSSTGNTIPSGVTGYCVGVELTPAGVPISATAPFFYTTL